MDFTDSGSEKHNSSGMDTYVLEWDSDESESSAMRGSVSIISMKNRQVKPVLINKDAQCEVTKKNNITSSTSICTSSILAQEIFTQTSKTIIELAEMDGAVKRPVDSNTLETQTSFVSITEKKTLEYRIELSQSTQNFTKNEMIGDSGENSNELSCHQIFPNSLDDGSSKFVISDTDNDCTSDNSSSTNPKIYSPTPPEITDSKDNMILSENQNEYENTSEFDQSADATDIEEDSLMEPKHPSKIHHKKEIRSDGSRTPVSVDEDVAELYAKLSETMEFRVHSPTEQDKKRFGYLTPLTEESVARRDSTGDVTASAPANVTSHNEDVDKDVLFTNNAGIKVKLFPRPDNNNESDMFKLPPIQGNANCPESLNFLFTLSHNKMMKAGNLPFVYEDRKERSLDRWELGGKNLAAGESLLISGRSGKFKVGYNLVLRKQWSTMMKIMHINSLQIWQ